MYARRVYHIFIVGVLLIAPIGVVANGTRLPNQNAHATARGNAFVATADNPSAVYYNPAGIARLDGLRIQSEAYVLAPSNHYIAPDGRRVDMDDKVFVLPQFFATWSRPDSPLAFGLGVYSPFGTSTSWPSDSGFRTLATTNKITFIRANPVIAWQATPTLSVGAGLMFDRARANLRRGIGFLPNDEFRFRGNGSNTGFNAGLLWQPTVRHSFGLNYMSRFTLGFSGESEFSPFSPPESASLDLPFPEILAGGWSFRPTEAWNLELAVDWTNWEILDTVTLQQPSGPLPISFEWKGSLYYMAGVTRYLHDGWLIAGGWTYSENSVRDIGFNPAVPDGNRNLGSIGFGRENPFLSWFVMYQRGFTFHRTVSGSPVSATLESADGTFKNSLHAIAASVHFSF